MTSLPPSIAAVPESPSPGASPPPVVAFPVQEGEAPLLSVESASVATTPNHLNRPLVSKDSSKTKSTAEELWQPDLAWSPHRQPGIETAATAQSMDPCHPSPTIGVSFNQDVVSVFQFHKTNFIHSLTLVASTKSNET